MLDRFAALAARVWAARAASHALESCSLTIPPAMAAACPATPGGGMPGWRSGGMVGGTRGGWLVGGRGAFSGCGGCGCVGATLVQTSLRQRCFIRQERTNVRVPFLLPSLNGSHGRPTFPFSSEHLRGGRRSPRSAVEDRIDETMSRDARHRSVQAQSRRECRTGLPFECALWPASAPRGLHAADRARSSAA